MRLLVLGLVLSTANVTAADPKVAKPTAAEAAKTAAAWFEAGDGSDDLKPVLALTASTFLGSADSENDSDVPACKLASVTKPAEREALVKCMTKHHFDRPETWSSWSAKIAKRSLVAIKRQKAKLDKLAKTSTVLSVHPSCAGSESQLVVAVVMENGAPKVNAVLYEDIFCGE